MADDLERVTLLKALVLRRGWTYSVFLAEYERAAATLHREHGAPTRNLSVSEPQFRRWTAGDLKGLPSGPARQVLELLFQRPVARLFEPASAEDLSPPSAPEIDMEAEINMAARDAQNRASEAAAASVSDTTLDQLRDDVAILARRYAATGPFQTFSQAQALLHQAEDLRDRTQVPIQQQELLILAGQASALLASAAFDLGQLSGAARLFRTAALYGETARCEPLQAFAGGGLAYIAYRTGRPGDAVRLVGTALAFSGLGDVARRRLLAIQARAFGHLGDHGRARAAIQASQDAAHGARDDLHDDVAGEFGFSKERLVMSCASTSLLVGDGQQAEEFAAHALQLVSARPTEQRSDAIMGKACVDLARARLLRSDVDAAVEALEPVWSVAPPHRVSGLLERTAAVRQVLAHGTFRSAPSAVALGERIENFTREALPRLSPGPVAALEA
ncbi:DNA-binding protein [Streptomyces sp. MI02-7b]|uniref:DNA-binding protein n=1 Tax=Streptomyces sp. MI02-7b TaxID=462941 RepID=UPI0029A96F14|nr:DNA-binding protein [Streptomyces sp. MI02-7b]MDX3075845.1 DNA-binding protein [Streptomyces sp. MI02-7b]